MAIDLFDELQEQNVSGSGGGSQRLVRAEHDGVLWRHRVRALHRGAVLTFRPADLGEKFSFCHIDGGHTARETCEDPDFSSRILLPGGLGLDDYFNPAFPGVCEGAIKFWLAHQGTLMPIAAAFNKVLFQKAPAPLDLNAAFDWRFPYIPHKTTTLWDTEIHSFGSFRAFIDTRASTPGFCCQTNRLGSMPC